MAVTVTVLKKTHQEAIVKVAGTADVGTINISTDLLPESQALTVGGTPTVNIVSANWTGLPNSTIVVARDGVTILPITGDAPQMVDLSGVGYVDSINNTSNITVTIAGSEAVIYLTLRKVAGYSSKVELAQFGSHDDPTQVGS